MNLTDFQELDHKVKATFKKIFEARDISEDTKEIFAGYLSYPVLTIGDLNNLRFVYFGNSLRNIFDSFFFSLK